MTQRQQQGNGTFSRFWSFFAPAYDFRYLQRWIYLPAQDEMIALLNTMESPTAVADIGCGTGILADRIEHETQASRCTVWTCRRACSPRPGRDRHGLIG